jgi:hypothetical protein
MSQQPFTSTSLQYKRASSAKEGCIRWYLSWDYAFKTAEVVLNHGADVDRLISASRPLERRCRMGFSMKLAHTPSRPLERRTPPALLCLSSCSPFSLVRSRSAAAVNSCNSRLVDLGSAQCCSPRIVDAGSASGHRWWCRVISASLLANSSSEHLRR